MSETAPPPCIHLMASLELELPPLLQALPRVSLLVAQELGRPWPIGYSVGPLGPLPAPPPALVEISMLHEMLPPLAPMPAVAARWHALLEGLAEAGVPVLLCNVFRHIGPLPPVLAALTPMALRERARQLNLLAVSLSHRHGADLADIDARLAALGGRLLQGDFLLGGWAGAAASDAIAWSLLQGEVQALAPEEAGARAAARHGGIAGIRARLRQHIAAGLTPAELDRELRQAGLTPG